MSSWYPFELLTHFRIQYALALIILLPLIVLSYRGQNLFLAANRIRFAELLLFLLTLILNVGLILGVYVGNPTARSESAMQASGRKIKCIQINLLMSNTNYKSVADYVTAQNPDIVSFEEVALEWGQQLPKLLTQYPHSKIFARDDFFGTAIFSKFPLTGEELVLSKAGIPVLLASIDIEGKKLNYLCVHALPPVEPAFLRDRNQEMGNIVELRRKNPGPFVVAGDFNCSPWSEAFWKLCRDGNLKDSEQLIGPQPSWPSYVGIPLIPIDHFFVSPDIEVSSRKVGPQVGSDHYPVEMTISF